MGKDGMRQRSALSQRQRTGLGARQRQSLAVLALSLSELEAYSREALESNPFLRGRRRGGQEGSSGEAEARIPAEPGFRDDLERQLRLATRETELLAIGDFLIGSLDSKGYLRVPAAEIAGLTHAPEALVLKAIELLQSLEPAGICARHLGESLRLQLDRQAEPNRLALRILDECLDELTARDFGRITRVLGASEAEVGEALRALRALRPYPLWGLATEWTAYALPELTVRTRGRELSVEASTRGPGLLLDDGYLEVYRRASERERASMLPFLDEARLIVTSVERRRLTLVGVAEEVVAYQSEFFLSGEPPRALTQAEVARALSLSVSTVSRAVRGKFLKFRGATYAMKSFFSPALKSGLSRDQVKAVIKDIIEGGREVSDAQIARYLLMNGQPISRRTVTKYRNEMRIPRAGRRPSLAASGAQVPYLIRSQALTSLAT